MKLMKPNSGLLILAILALAAAVARAQTNDLATLLQQGLIEEQANRNLPAAIADYSALARQFDQHRQIAATAIFRLGECYRALGKTNEAAAQYQRILRDFPDQTTLATLSGQNLAGMGVATEPPATQAHWQRTDIAMKDLALLEANRVANPTAPPPSAEDEEITRLTQMIQNSPDLINGSPAQGSPLGRAAMAGQLQVAAFLLANGADVNAPCDTDEDTPLMGAAQTGHKAMVDLLLQHGANINAVSKFKQSALQLAVGQGYAGVAETLLAAKANPNLENWQQQTPLITAAQNGSDALVTLLLANHADVNARNTIGETPLFLAVRSGQLKVVQQLLAAGAKVDFKTISGGTVLNYALRTTPEMFQTLLQAGADPNTVDKQGRTPLSYAVERDSPEIGKMLLAAKADPNDGKRDAPLLMAINAQNTNTAALLLQAGANPNKKGTVNIGGVEKPPIGNYPRDGVTPLYAAVTTKQLPMVQLLLKYKADPNVTQTDGQSLLCSALAQPEIFRALLDAGADANAKTIFFENWSMMSHVAFLGNFSSSDQFTVLEAAAWQNQPESVGLLLQHGAAPNAVDGEGNTPLHYAAASLADATIFTALLDAHANPNVRNAAGWTPLNIITKGIEKEQAERNSPTLQGAPVFNGVNLAVPRRFDSAADKEAQAKKLIALLRQHGALEQLPDWNGITISRPAANFSKRIFEKGTNDWNQVSLFDVLGVQYNLVASPIMKVARSVAWPYSKSSFATDNSLSFPDFSSVVIRHPLAGGKKWETRQVNLIHALDSGDCGADILLQWGDVVEIPEADHVINQPWTGLTTNQLLTLKNCLTRHLQITVTGRTTNFVASPQVTVRPGNYVAFGDGAFPDVKLITGEPFMLWPVLEESKLLLVSSDLSHVKIKRTDAAGKVHEWTVDCSNPNSPPNFWLRNGDVIEVPEKP